MIQPVKEGAEVLLEWWKTQSGLSGLGSSVFGLLSWELKDQQ